MDTHSIFSIPLDWNTDTAAPRRTFMVLLEPIRDVCHVATMATPKQQIVRSSEYLIQLIFRNKR